MGRKLGWLLVAVLSGCGVDDEPATAIGTSALTGSNGMWQNGLWQNGLSTNGLWQNGLWQNGMWQNGMWQNGMWQNGLWQNGMWQNGMWQNGVAVNGMWQNGMWQNGLWQNGMWQNGLEHEMLANNGYTRQLLGYLYNCAMPPGASKTLDAGGGVTVSLEGGVGLWPVWAESADGTTCDASCQERIARWKTKMPAETPVDQCGESCQRWLSACVLARTNAYGVNVMISMRAPADAPEGIKDVLELAPGEADGYDLREGAYYGNIFQTWPAGPEADAPVINVPQYFACAGPGSNVPDITKRFSSSQGATTVIKNTGICQPTSGRPGACTPTPSGESQCVAPGSAATSMTPALPDRRFSEVITVYLKTPIATCGNAVCEAGETSEGEKWCPSDCTAGGWAVTVDRSVSSADRVPLTPVTAISPLDDAIYMVGAIGINEVVDLDGAGGVPGVSAAANSILLARYTRDGHLEWQRTYTPANQVFPRGIAVDANNHIAVIGHQSTWEWDVPGVLGMPKDTVWVAKFDAAGAILPSWPQETGGNADIYLDAVSTYQGFGGVRIDSDGAVIIAGGFDGRPARFGSFEIVSDTSGNIPRDVFVAKLSAAGPAEWATRLGGPSYDQFGAMALDGEGSIYVTTKGGNGRLHKLLPDGTPASWSRMLPGAGGTGVATHNGNVFVSGRLTGGFGFDFGTGPLGTDLTVNSMYVASYTSDGVARWATLRASRFTSFGFVTADASLVDVTPDGTVVTGGIILSEWGGLIDFGAGVFPTYESIDAFIAGFSDADGTYSWAKHVPFVLDGAPSSMNIDSGGRIVLSGSYSGSMVVDNRLLVTSKPELDNWGNLFVSSISPPGVDTNIAPVISEVQAPQSVLTSATSAGGAVVWFLPPTVTDEDYSGTSVYCDPPPNSVFRVGLTEVTCTAKDVFGNAAEPFKFNVTVIDRVGPELSDLTAITVPATSADGAVVTFDPTAKDQVTGPAPVSCAPSSGSAFQLGETNVTCAASDRASPPNTTTGVFKVRVVDATGPALTVPASVNAHNGTARFMDLVSASDVVDGDVAITCSPPESATFETETTVTCTATDDSGNTSEAAFQVLTPSDTTPPVLDVPANVFAPATAMLTPVSYAARATDDIDGALQADCVPASGSFFAIGTTRVSCTATDLSFNTASASFDVVVEDTQAPYVTAPDALTVEATSPGGAEASFLATAVDNVDGSLLATCDPPGGMFSLGSTSVTCVAVDSAGNAGSAMTSVTIVDTTPPTIVMSPSVTVEALGGEGAVVDYQVTATDVASAALAISCSHASGGVFALGATIVRCTATDASNNTAYAELTVTVQDTTAPTLNLPAPITATATGSGATVTFAVSADDSIDGIIPWSCDRASGSSFPVGVTTVNCSASDASGNTASGSFTVTVLAPPPPPATVSWSGILQPINADDSSIFKINSTIPVKFKLTGDSAGRTNLQATLTWTKIANSIVGAELEPAVSTTPDTGNTFRYDASGDLYIFNMATKGLTAGGYQLRINLGDGVSHTVTISLKK